MFSKGKSLAQGHRGFEWQILTLTMGCLTLSKALAAFLKASYRPWNE
jgi:hypothetical protein